MDKLTDEEKFWDNLTKEYLTVDQKIAIIKEHNAERSAIEWDKIMDSLRDYLNKSAN